MSHPPVSGSAVTFFVARFLFAGTLGIGLGYIVPEPMRLEILSSREIGDLVVSGQQISKESQEGVPRLTFLAC